MNVQETKEKTRIFGSFLVILSVVILFADKVTNFELYNNFSFKNTNVFIWTLTQSLSPFLLIFAVFFKPYKTSFLVPIYFYAIQLYWVFDRSMQLDDYLLHVYAIGVVFFTVFLVYLIDNIQQAKKKDDKQVEDVIEEIKKTVELLKERID